MKTKKNIKGGAVPPPKKIGSKFRFKLPTNYYEDITNDNMDTHIDPEKYDVIIVTTDHSKIDYELIGKHALLVVDTRNIMSSVKKPKARIVMA